MFGRLTVRGTGAAVIYREYFTAAVVAKWAVTHESSLVGGDGVWRLAATLTRADRFYLRQRPLHFTVPRPGGGLWCWPVLELTQLSETAITARLDLPEA